MTVGIEKMEGKNLLRVSPPMKQIMAIMAERDAAIQERNLAISEKKAALAERDMAILQRDSAISERNNTIMERDNAIATLQYRENSMNSGNISPCPTGCQISRGIKHVHHPQQYIQHHHQPNLSEAPHINTRDMHTGDSLPISPVAPEPAKSRRTRRTKAVRAGNKKNLKSSKKVKMECDDLNNALHDLNRQLGGSKLDWKD